LDNLEELELADNRIQNITNATFYGLPRLQQLDLFDNQIRFVDPQAFANTPALVEIILGGNNVVECDDIREQLPKACICLKKNW